jgi:DNA polymerase (family 10)
MNPHGQEPVPPADGPPPSNAELAAALGEVGDLLELRGEVVYKTIAYRRAADAVAHSAIPVAAAYRSGTPPRIEGVGATISEALAELSRTGRLGLLERLRDEVPPGLRDLLSISGVGPRTARLVHDALGVASIDDLRRAAETGALRKVHGLSERTERSILTGIAALERRTGRLLLDEAEAIVERLERKLAGAPGVVRVVAAGSFRRRRETIGDLDLLAETADGEAVLERLVGLPEVEAVLSRGERRGSVRLSSGVQVDVMIMPPGRAGPYLVHFTGSKEHNVRLRSRARDRGWSLSELGYAALEPPAGHGAEPLTFATEEETYRFLDLAFIEPELREDRGEIEAAAAGRLPLLVDSSDLRGDLHSHSDWTDGAHSIEAMAEAARARGYSYLVLTDHTMSLGVARGLDPAGFAEQRTIVDRLNERFAADEAAGTAPAGVAPDGFRLLHGCELEIRADGRLDLPEEVLATFDLVVASLHVGRRQPRERLTGRVLGAIRSPHVDVIAHPSGRKIDRREDLDLDWDRVYEAAAETGTALEVNGSPDRLDLADERIRAALAAGCRIAIDSDAHRTGELDFRRYGLWQARRAWAEAGAIVNARGRDELIAWAAGKPGRVS